MPIGPAGDRVTQAFGHFKPLDGRFSDNALLQVKTPSSGTYGSTGRNVGDGDHRAVTLDGAL